MAVSVSGSWIPMVSGVLALSGQPAPPNPPSAGAGIPRAPASASPPSPWRESRGMTEDVPRGQHQTPAYRRPPGSPARAARAPYHVRNGRLVFGVAADRDRSPSRRWADVGYVGWALPASVGLVQLARGTPRRLPGLRVNLDAVVIAGSLLFASWTLVLQSALSRSHEGPWAKAVAVMYPLSDAVIATMVWLWGVARRSADVGHGCGCAAEDSTGSGCCRNRRLGHSLRSSSASDC
jgi:hypothetical protein